MLGGALFDCFFFGGGGAGAVQREAEVWSPGGGRLQGCGFVGTVLLAGCACILCCWGVVVVFSMYMMEDAW